MPQADLKGAHRKTEPWGTAEVQWKQLPLPHGLAMRLEIALVKTLYSCVTICCLLGLQGCFQNDGNKTKANTDSSQASVQMPQGNSEGKR
jgi:hypothetical protein